jgi:hypothetical protein
MIFVMKIFVMCDPIGYGAAAPTDSERAVFVSAKAWVRFRFRFRFANDVRKRLGKVTLAVRKSSAQHFATSDVSKFQVPREWRPCQPRQSTGAVPAALLLVQQNEQGGEQRMRWGWLSLVVGLRMFHLSVPLLSCVCALSD